MKAEKNLFHILMELSPLEQEICRNDPEYFIRRWVAHPNDKVEVIEEEFQPHIADQITVPNLVKRIKFVITEPSGYSRTYHFGKQSV